MSTRYNYKPGDFVDKISSGPGATFSMFAYIRDTDGMYCTAMDTIESQTMLQSSPPHKLLRGNGERVTTRVCDYMEAEFPCHGLAQSLFSITKESKIKAGSAHAKLPRPRIIDLPAPDPAFVYKDAETEAKYREIFGGQFVAVWRHDLKFTTLPENDGDSSFTRKLTIQIDVYDTSIPSKKMGSFSFFTGPIADRDPGSYLDVECGIRHHAWDGMPGMTTSQRTSFAVRVIHFVPTRRLLGQSGA
jgi:hypothetical protein